VKELSKDHPDERIKDDVFEQIVDFTLSEQYTGVNGVMLEYVKHQVLIFC